MEPHEELQPEDSEIGTCQRCGTTFTDVYDFQGDVLPDYVPLRLVEYRERDESTLGEWCSRACFLDEVRNEPQSIIRRVTPTPSGGSALRP